MIEGSSINSFNLIPADVKYSHLWLVELIEGIEAIIRKVELLHRIDGRIHEGLQLIVGDVQDF